MKSVRLFFSALLQSYRQELPLASREHTHTHCWNAMIDHISITPNISNSRWVMTRSRSWLTWRSIMNYDIEDHACRTHAHPHLWWSSALYISAHTHTHSPESLSQKRVMLLSAPCCSEHQSVGVCVCVRDQTVCIGPVDEEELKWEENVAALRRDAPDSSASTPIHCSSRERRDAWRHGGDAAHTIIWIIYDTYTNRNGLILNLTLYYLKFNLSIIPRP